MQLASSDLPTNLLEADESLWSRPEPFTLSSPDL